MTADRAFWLFVAFAAAVFLAGGGSRYDIESVAPLRFVAALVLALAVIFQTQKSVRRIAAPLAIIVLLAVWMALQLVPLPSSIWSSLPGREDIHELGQLVGLGDVWRPISISPVKTANSLASLIVPAAALLVLALLDDKGWKRLPWVFIIAGVASAAFGIAQIALSGADGLYLYEITNTGSAVGLFSNRNHNAMFLTIALIFCAVRLEQFSVKQLNVADLAAAASALIIFTGILVNASRAGLVGLGLVGLVVATRALLHWRAEVADRRRALGRLVVSIVVGAFSLGVILLFAVLGRSPAVERLLADDAAVDQRLESLPYVWQMLWDNQPFGVGFGAFEQAFYTIEPVGLLGPRYLNHAHNDWLQFGIEGGLPALLIALLAIAAIAMRVLRIARAGGADRPMTTNAWLGALAIMIFALASIVDYPLRTPSLMVVAVAGLAMLFKPIAASAR